MGAEASKVTKRVTDNQDFQSFSNFHPGYIQKLKERFELAKESFTLDREDLKELFNSSQKETDVIFAHFDQDDDGVIDQYEFTTALAFLCHGTLEEKGRLIFQLYDFDKSQYISKDELTILMTNSLTALRALEKGPAPSIEEIETKTNEFFLKSDTDGNERVTLDEFTSFIRRDPDVLKCLIGYGIAKTEDLGQNVGDDEEPFYDSDLEIEGSKAVVADAKKNGAKYGIEFEFEQDGEGGIVAVTNEEVIKQRNEIQKEITDNMGPTGYQPQPIDLERPDASIELDYIYGYRCHDARSNLKYTKEGKIVYHAAGVGIVLDQANNTQQHMLEHDDDIICLAVDQLGEFAATGQIGEKPWLCVWNTETMECVARYRTPFTKGINNIEFSHSGDHIVASGMDDDHTLAVFEWKKKVDGKLAGPIATGRGPSSTIWSVGFNSQNNQVILTTSQDVWFYSFEKGVIQGTPGKWDGKPAANLCQCIIGNDVYTGTHDGQVIIWKDQKVKSRKKNCHEGPIYSICAKKSSAGMITGGKDGKIVVWTMAGDDITISKSMDLKSPEIKSLNPRVKSVYEHPIKGNVLVGTRGGEIVEFGAKKTAVLVKSHYEKELWGLAPHPKKAEFLTVGQDGVLGVWDIAKKRQTRYARLECGADAVAYSNNGSNIAIGMRNGYLLVVDEAFAPVAKTQHSKTGKEITVIKFSPDDSICAVGGNDGRVRLYDVKSKFRKAKVIKKNTCAVTHLDFSLDGQQIITNSSNGEVLHFETSSGKHLPSTGAVKDARWHTWSCTFGWHVQGIYPANSNGFDVISCARSPESNGNGTVIATGDDFGRVNLYRFPCPLKNATGTQSIGHSAKVTNVCFSPTTKHLLTCGGADLCVFQWHYRYDDGAADDNITTNQNKSLAQEEDDCIILYQQEQEAKEKIMAGTSFINEIKNSTPAGFKAPAGASYPTEANLRLKYAHGYRCKDTRGNVKYSADGNIVYTAAALGIVLNKQSNQQQFFNLHQQDVISLDIHPNKEIVATGHVSSAGRKQIVEIFVWSVKTQQVIARLSDFHCGAVTSLKFSPDGSKLLSIGADEHNYMAVYDWANQLILCSAKSGLNRVFDCSWQNENQFMTADAKLIQFHKIAGKTIVTSKGVLGKLRGRLQQNRCCTYAFNSEMTLSGNQTGEILQWENQGEGKVVLAKVHKAHSGVVWQIVCIDNQSRVVSGANDCKLILWDNTMKQLQAIDLRQVDTYRPEVRSIDYSEASKTFLIGTRGAEIFEVSAQGKIIGTLVSGHSSNTSKSQLSGVACHPTEQLFATCGSDRKIKLWTENSMKLQSGKEFTCEIYSIDWSPCGKFLIAGNEQGYIHSVNASNLTIVDQVCQKSDTKGQVIPVKECKISPDGQFIAFGIQGGKSNVEIASIDKNFKLKHEASIDVNMQSGLMHLDWSLDSTILVVNSQYQELIFVNVKQQKVVEASSVKNVKWSTWTSKFGFPTQGIFNGSNYAQYQAVDRSNPSKVLAATHASGLVKLFKYPCTESNSASKDFRGHGSRVNRVRFSADDKYLISVGGNDQTVLVWETDFTGAEDKNNDISDPQADAALEEDLTDMSKVQKQKEKQTKNALKQQSSLKDQSENDKQNKQKMEKDQLKIMPWKGQLKPPSGYSKPIKNQAIPPHVQAKIEWVHGYKGNKTRNNVRYLIDGSIAYHAAALGIVYDPKNHTQRHFNKHTDEITAIAFADDKKTIATGEIGSRPKIIVWDGISMGVIQTFQGKLHDGIRSMSFSPSGKLLAAIDTSAVHQIALFSVDSGVCLALTQGDKSQILDIQFKDESVLATSGVRHLKFWNYDKELLPKNAQWGSETDKNLACIAFDGEQTLTGTAKGNLLVWKSDVFQKSIQCHSDVIDAIRVSANYVYTGGRDMKLNVLDKSYNKVINFDIGATFGSVCGQPRAIDFDTSEKNLVIGTFGSEIFSVPIEIAKSSLGKHQCLIQGHYCPKQKDTNEVWGLCKINNKELPDYQYITVGDDATLRVWNADKKQMVKLVDLNRHADGNPLPLDPQTKEVSLAAQARCVDASTDGSLVAVGFRSGQFRVYQTKTWKMAAAKKSPMKDWIQDIKFSPDQRYLAVGSHDHSIYVFAFPKVEIHCQFSASTAFISHLDWSLDSRYLRSNDGGNQLFYFDVASQQQEENGSTTLRDKEWYTSNCPITWGSQGIWRTTMDGSEVYHCDRSKNSHQDGYHLLATGDEQGMVKIFRYPCMVEPSEPLICRGHSSHVTKVKFGPKRLFSTGGNDSTIIQWKIEM